MSDTKETPEGAENEAVPLPISQEISDFNFLITTLVDYYVAKSGMKGDSDEGEEWKKGTQHERMDIPKKVDDAVERAFLNQLKKFY